MTTFERELAKLEDLEGIRIFREGDNDCLAWRTKPFLPADKPKFSKPLLKLVIWWAIGIVCGLGLLWRIRI